MRKKNKNKYKYNVWGSEKLLKDLENHQCIHMTKMFRPSKNYPSRDTVPLQIFLPRRGTEKISIILEI
jgi:hypothetical protein